MAPKRKDRTKHVALTPQDVSKAAERIQKLRITCDPAEITAGLKELITVSNACSGTRGGLTRADLESWAGIHLRFLTCMFDYSIVLTAEIHGDNVDKEITNYPVLLTQSLRIIAEAVDAWVGDPETLCALCSLILVVTHPENVTRAFHIVGQKAAHDIASNILHIFAAGLLKMHAANNIDMATVDRIYSTCIALQELAQSAHLSTSGNDTYENVHARCAESDNSAPCDANADEGKRGSGERRAEKKDVNAPEGRGKKECVGDADTLRGPIMCKTPDEALLERIMDQCEYFLDKNGEIKHAQTLCHEEFCLDRLLGIFILVMYAGWYLSCASHWKFWPGGL